MFELRTETSGLPQTETDWPAPIMDQRYLAEMPYGLGVLATYRGELPAQDDLPSHHNAIGDIYLVAGTPFVSIWVPHAAHADCIDP